MPYIDGAQRKKIDDGDNLPASSGELNYAITRLITQYLGANARYSDYNTVIGALECAKFELYRRLIAPYENKKLNENGDVYL